MPGTLLLSVSLNISHLYNKAHISIDNIDFNEWNLPEITVDGVFLYIFEYNHYDIFNFITLINYAQWWYLCHLI